MSAGKWLMLLGVFLFAAGVILTYAPNLFGWFGKLPGDIRIEGKSGFVFIPITSMIVVSVLLTLILNLLFRR